MFLKRVMYFVFPILQGCTNVQNDLIRFSDDEMLLFFKRFSSKIRNADLRFNFFLDEEKVNNTMSPYLLIQNQSNWQGPKIRYTQLTFP